MTNYPINYSFVSPRTVTTEINGVSDELTILTFDKVANKNYWDKITRFKQLIQDSIDKNDPVVEWECNPAFFDLATIDVIDEDKIANAEVNVIEDTEPARCHVKYKSGANVIF